MLTALLFLASLAQANSAARTSQALESSPGANYPALIYHPGSSGVTVPKLVHSVDPRYSDEARKKKITGTCLLSLIVNVKGEPEDVRVIRSISTNLKPKLQAAGQSLDDAAVAAVQQYRFEPSTLDGRTVPVEIHVEVHYHLYPRFF